MKKSWLLIACLSGVSFAQTYGNFTYIPKVDAITDKDKSLIAADAIGGSDKGFIVIRCDIEAEGGYDIYVNFKQYLDNEEVSVIHRFGSNKASVPNLWDNSTDGVAVFAPWPLKRTFLQGLKVSPLLTMRAESYAGTPYTLQINLKGFTQAATKLKCLKGK